MRLSRSKVESDTVTTSFAMSFAGGDSNDVVTATLRYNVLEPFAVTASFALTDAPAVQWVLARDLLREGVVLPSGIGDIRIYPTDERIVVELHSPGGRAVLTGPIAPVIDFVQSIYRVVPDGAELEYFSVDAELDLLAELRERNTDGLDV